jgi:GntR family transcriptional regulator/MocR family aminotransferase
MDQRPAASLLIHVDSRSRQTLQQQTYAALSRAIREGTLAPASRVLSSRALAADLGVSRTTTLLAMDQLLAEGYLTTRRGSGTFVARELPDDLPQQLVSRRGSTPRHPPLSARGATLAAIPPPSRRLGGPPRAFRVGVPALELFPVGLWSRLANRRLRAVTRAQLDYGDPGGLRPLREASAAHVRAARGTQCGADQVLVVRTTTTASSVTGPGPSRACTGSTSTAA